LKTVERSDERIHVSEIFEGERTRTERPDLGMLREPARDVPVYRECDVLVVGGGPSGTAAAVAAARLGAEVVLLERYNHLGGLSTGGLVIWIDRMTDWSGKLVIRGFAEEIMDRLPREAVAGPARKDWGSRDAASAAHWAQRTAAFHGIVTWSPTVDPERLKLASQEIVLAQKVHLVFHSWAALPLLEDGKVRGAFFESKAGRQAVRAKVVVDATGDGDLFARAGAAYESDIETADIHHCMNTAWLLGGVEWSAGSSSGQAAPRSSRNSWRAAARNCAPSSGLSFPGATTLRSSWARASPAFRRSTWTTRPKSKSAPIA
jgi:hypothetical protein